MTRDHEPVVPPKEPLRDGDLVVRLPEADDLDALVALGEDPDVAETISVPIPHPCPRGITEAPPKRVPTWVGGTVTHFGPTLITADVAMM